MIYKMKKVLVDNRAAAAIEYAILVPIFLILSLGVIEFGYYFVRDEIVSNAVSTVAQTLQRDPNYYLSLTPSQLTTVVKSYGSGLVNFTQAGDYICVDAYKTAVEAASAPTCTSTHFNTSNPNPSPPSGTAATPYYIAVRADLKKVTITPLGNFVPGVKNIHVAQSSGAVEIGSLLPPKCGTGQPLTFDGTKFSCMKLTPYIIAAGIARPGSVNGKGAISGSYWETDKSHVYGDQHYLTLCKQGVTFTIPTGLPKGRLIAEGTLIYPGANDDGDWHAWTVTFNHMNLPVSGGTGSMDVCESSGGNWNRDNDIPGVGAENIAWTVTFIPD